MNSPPLKFNDTLPSYLDDVLTHLDWVNHIPYWKCELIAAIDKQEEYCHVQFIDWDDESLEKPRVWRIKAWKVSYFKHCKDKEIAAVKRRELNLQTENTDLLMKRMSSESGIEDKEIFRKLAAKIAARKLTEIAEKQFKAKLDV